MSRSTEVTIRAFADGTIRDQRDSVAVERPLELRLRAGGVTRSLAVTMCTPGHEIELAAGFALGEGIITRRSDLHEIIACDDGAITVTLSADILPETNAFERHFAVTSACGVCGRSELQALRERVVPIESDLRLSIETLYTLPDTMRNAQRVFARTGGLHAAAAFDVNGELLALREDIGRHNALDKLIGWAFLNAIDLSSAVVLVSGRASYELLQKSVVARVPILASVSAPSTFAIEIAVEFGITLAGFLRGRHVNIYSGTERITMEPSTRTNATTR